MEYSYFQRGGDDDDDFTTDPSKPSSSTSPGTTIATSGPTVETLTRMSIELIQTFTNATDFSTLVHEYLAADYFDTFDGRVVCGTREEFLARQQQMAVIAPEYRCHVINTACEVSEHNGRAKVWLTVTATGLSPWLHHSGRLEREWVLVLHWRKRKATGWICWKSNALTTGGPGS